MRHNELSMQQCGKPTQSSCLSRKCQVEIALSPFIEGSLKRPKNNNNKKKIPPNLPALGESEDLAHATGGPWALMGAPSFQHVLEHRRVHLHGLEAPVKALEGGLLSEALPPADKGLHHLGLHVVGVVGLTAVDVGLGQAQRQHHGLPLGAQPLRQLVDLPVGRGAIEDVRGDSSHRVIWGRERHERRHQTGADKEKVGEWHTPANGRGQPS